MKHIQRKDYVISNATLDAVLKQCLDGTGLEYELTDNQVVVIRKATVKPEKVEKVTLSGVVKDEKGETLPGVTVMIKGTTLGGTTDIDGKYSLTVPFSDNMTLVFSFVGMETQEVVYKGQSKIDVTLVPSMNEMSEVVVTGIFTRRAESYHGAAVP